MRKKKKNHAKTLAVLDESQMKFGCFFIPSSGMKKQQWINGVYQTNDGNGRKLCAALVRARASFDDADTEKVQRRVDEEMKNRRGRRGRPNLGIGVCVRRIPQLKHTKLTWGHAQLRTKST